MQCRWILLLLGLSLALCLRVYPSGGYGAVDLLRAKYARLAEARKILGGACYNRCSRLLLHVWQYGLLTSKTRTRQYSNAHWLELPLNHPVNSDMHLPQKNPPTNKDSSPVRYQI